MKTKDEIVRAVEQYADTVRRICILYLKNQFDSEDIFQDVFLKYALYDKSFENEEHEKAWLIRVTINCCKDSLKSFFRRNTVSVDDCHLTAGEDKVYLADVRAAVAKLPGNYKNAVYLFYYEGYTAAQIGRILGKKENTIYTWLKRGREQLKKELGDDYLESD